MTARETLIAKRILDFLHSLDAGQAHALVIHASIGGMNFCSSNEFDDALAALDTKKFVIGIKTKFKGTVWNISDAGEAARVEM